MSKPLVRLFKSGVLNRDDIQAALSIEDAVVSIFTCDIHSSVQDLGFEKEEALKKRVMAFFESRQVYYDWFDAMTQAGLSAGPVLDVVLEGRPLHEIDKERHRRKGWTRELVVQGLTLFRMIKDRNETKPKRLTA